MLTWKLNSNAILRNYKKKVCTFFKRIRTPEPEGKNKAKNYIFLKCNGEWDAVSKPCFLDVFLCSSITCRISKFELIFLICDYFYVDNA